MLYSIELDDLEDFVHNKAKPGDIIFARDGYWSCTRFYFYLCSEDNIGKDINPCWITEREFKKLILENKFMNMSLEEKVDFLINDYINNNS